jgi:hypothetical protein
VNEEEISSSFNVLRNGINEEEGESARTGAAFMLIEQRDAGKERCKQELSGCRGGYG